MKGHIEVEPTTDGKILLHFPNGAVERWRPATGPSSAYRRIYRYDGEWWTFESEVVKGKTT